MRKIGIFQGIFDPISEVEKKEALAWKKQEHLDYVIFQVIGEGILSKQEREKLVKQAISAYRKLVMELKIKPDDIVLTTISTNTNEERIRQGHFYLAATGIRKSLAEEGQYIDCALRAQCKESRYLHSLGVKDVCVDLAHNYHLNEHLAWMMGMLHDITKNKSDEWGEKILKLYDPSLLSMSPKVWHSSTAVIWLKQEMGIYNNRLLQAIKHHTLATSTSTYAMILYIADKCEAGRGYDTSKELGLARQNLKKGFQLVVKESEAYRKQERK